MTPVLPLRVELRDRPTMASATVEVAWMNQATWRHRHFGLKSAPRHRDFRPGMEGVS